MKAGPCSSPGAKMRSKSRHNCIVLEDNDPAALAQARGMTEIAKAIGIAREALYKALRSDAHPRFDTIDRACHALGVKLVAQPIKA